LGNQAIQYLHTKAANGANAPTVGQPKSNRCLAIYSLALHKTVIAVFVGYSLWTRDKDSCWQGSYTTKICSPQMPVWRAASGDAYAHNMYAHKS